MYVSLGCMLYQHELIDTLVFEKRIVHSKFDIYVCITDCHASNITYLLLIAMHQTSHIYYWLPCIKHHISITDCHASNITYLLPIAMHQTSHIYYRLPCIKHHISITDCHASNITYLLLIAMHQTSHIY